MVKKGHVSSVNTTNKTARVTFQDLDGVVTADIPYAPHVAIAINDLVAVTFFSSNMADGLIVAAF